MAEGAAFDDGEPGQHMSRAAMPKPVRGPIHWGGERCHVTLHPVRQLLGHGQRHALLKAKDVSLQLAKSLDEVSDAGCRRRAAKLGSCRILGEATHAKHVVRAHPHFSRQALRSSIPDLLQQQVQLSSSTAARRPAPGPAALDLFFHDATIAQYLPISPG